MIFNNVTENDISQEFLNLNSKKSGIFDNNPINFLKSSSDVLEVIPQNIWNSETLETNGFSDNLKLADVTLVYEKKGHSLVGKYRHVIHSISKFLKRIIQRQFSSYIDEFLSPYLCGYRKNFTL